MKRAFHGCSLASILVLGCSGAAEPSPTLDDESQPIAGGEPDTVDTNVIGMFSMATGGMCSGTLIAPNLVLTARHCVAKMTPDNGGLVICGVSTFLSPQSGESIYVSTDQQLSEQANWYQGSDVFVPTEGKLGCGFDVALIVLAENVPVPPRVPRIDIEPIADEPYTAVGYGQQGSGWGGERMVLGGLKVICGSGACSGGVASTEFLGDTGICPGDSGGPAIDAKGKVIGVVSRGGDGCSTPIYGSVSAWRDFIIPVAKDAAGKGGYDPPFWALSGKSDPEEPPPGTGGAGGAPSTDPTGQSCSATQGCASGFACFSDTDPNQGHCLQLCNSTTPCGLGRTCNAQGVCAAEAPSGTAPPRNEQSGGCAVATERGPAEPAFWLVGVLIGLLRRRRR